MKNALISHLRLELPHVSYKDTYLAGMAELQTHSDKSAWIYLGDKEPHDTPAKDFEAYVNTLRSTETNPLPGFVRNTCYWAIFGNEMVGRIAIRHELNEFLAKIGGHIGYIVRPSFRNQGVASEMLRQLLQTEQAKTIGKLLITCDEDNIASEKTILKNGGIFETLVPNGDKPKKKRFWIDLSQLAPHCEYHDAGKPHEFIDKLKNQTEVHDESFLVVRRKCNRWNGPSRLQLDSMV